MKRLIDIVISGLSILILTPLLLPIILLLRITGEGEVFFSQVRIGKGGSSFRLHKFATMLKDSPNIGSGTLTVKNDPRILPLGHFLRKTKINELPQLFNILKGDMSIVGPRPLLIRYLPRYNNTQKQRHNVRPGITGWAQVNGRNAISWEQKFKLDVYYVNNISCILDLKILFKTVYKVIKKDGIYSTDNEIVPDFMGEEQNKY